MVRNTGVDPITVEIIGKSCVCLTRLPLKYEESQEIGRGLLKSFLLPRTVVPAVGNMAERVLPTIRVQSGSAKTRAERVGNYPRNP